MCLKFLTCFSSRTLLGVLTLICVGVLGAAYVMEHYFAVRPCQMCLYERNVFMGAGIFSLLSLLVLPQRFQHYALLILGFIFAGGALLAGYHVAIQQHWVSLPSFCSSNDFSAFESVEALKEQLLKTPLVRCDQVTWSLFGLSLAAYNAILSLVLVCVCWGWFWKQK
ncbi:MAG: disulfide bond formation protein B [Proteobacteria bacterium]|nr:disulfide bond formation protein B [Pseudomonadota bacterium]